MKSEVNSSFLGIKTSLANPPFNSAVSGKNFVIHRHRDPQSKIAGWIEQAYGYAKKTYVTGSGAAKTLPANDAVIRQITNLTPENFYNLYIPEHGGQNVCVLTATYTKTGYFTASPTVNRFGVWIRPYWSGSAWVDEWRELTEMFIFEIDALGTGDRKLYLDDVSASKYDFPTIDPTGIVFAADYFKDWTIVYAAFGDDQNYDLIGQSGYDTNRYYVQLLQGHENTEFTSRIAGTKIILYRNFLMQELPSSLASHIYGILSEARITSGNASTDLTLMAAHRDTSFIMTGIDDNAVDSNIGYTRAIDEVICDHGTPVVWDFAAMVCLAGEYTADAADALDQQSYYFKKSIVFDDGNETVPVNCRTTVAPEHTTWSTDNFVTITAPLKKIGYYIYRSLGALPRRAKYLRLYWSTDNVNFYKAKDFNLRDATLWQGIKVFGTAFNHVYAFAPGDFSTDVWLPLVPTTKFLVAADFDPEANSAVDQRGGMAMTDTGIIQYSWAAVVGNRTFAFNVRQGGVLYPNKVYTTPSNGDAQPMYDTFGSVAEKIVELEYNDGDETPAGWPYGDRLIAFKRRSVIIVSYDNSGGFIRDAITKADGLCSARTIADFENTVYWAGYNGIYAYSDQGIRLINYDWVEEWKLLSNTLKEAAVSVFDRQNRQYRIAYNGIEKCLDIDTGEWVPADITDQPSRFSVNQREGAVDFLSGTLIYTRGTGTLEDDANPAFEYVTNDFIGSQNQDIDLLLNTVRIAYDSDVALTVTLYRDGVAQTSVALAAGAGASTINAGLSFRCKRFALSIAASLTGDTQNIQIKEIVPNYQLVPAGVSRPAFASEGNAAAIEQRPITMAEIKSGTYNLTANVETVVPFTEAFSTTIGANYTLKADVYNSAGQWIMSAEASAQDRFGFTITSPETGYVRYIAAAYA